MTSPLRNTLQKTTTSTPVDVAQLRWPARALLKCCVPGCSNNERQHPGKVYYVFPAQEAVRTRWLQQINRLDLTEQLLTGENSNRVCSDHFAPSAYTTRGALQNDAVPTLRLRNEDDKVTVTEPDQTSLKRKSTENVSSITKKHRHNARAESSASYSLIETDPLDIGIHDVEVQCLDPLAVKRETGTHNAATQTFSRKDLFLSVACITTPDIIDLPQVFSEQEPFISRCIPTQTTANLVACFTTPVKKQLQAELKMINRQIKNATDFHMTQNTFMKSCEIYLNERVSRILASISSTQERHVGNRYTPEFKSFAVNLYITSQQSYRFVEMIFNLPSTVTLQRVQAPSRTGINQYLFDYLKMKLNSMSEKEKICTICFDVLRISKNLWYEVSNDFLCGMEEIDQIMGPEPAEYAAILMLRGLYTDWKQPVSFAFMTEKKHYPELKEWLHKIIGAMFDIGLNIKAFVADSNNGFMDVSVTSDNEHYFEIDGRKIYRFYDVRYLFKSVRDAFMEYNFHFGEKVAQWKHILKVYSKDKSHDFSLMPKITDDHVYPGGDDLHNPDLAIDLFSPQVAAAMNFFISAHMVDHKTKDTAEFIHKMSMYFDLFNSKTLATAYRGTEQQNQLISDLLQYLGLMEVIDKQMRYTEFQFVTGLAVNIRSLVSLLDDLKMENVQYVLTKCLRKDCAEEFFEECRRLGGNCCERPTAIMFARSFRRLFLNNLEIKNGVNQLDLKSSLNKIGEFDFGKRTEPECETLKICGIGDFKIQWPSNEYLAGYILCKCLEKHKCLTFLTKLSDHYQIPVENDAATLINTFKKYNAENVSVKNLIKPPDYLVNFVDHLDQKFTEYFSRPNLQAVNFGWNLYKSIEGDSFELPCNCFPLKFMKILFIRLKLEFHIRGHNKEHKNARKSRQQPAKKASGRKSK